MQDNQKYSLDKVAEHNISPEILYIAPATITRFQNSYRIIAPTCQQQFVLSKCMFSVTIVECSRMRHTCMTKTASHMTCVSLWKGLDLHENPKKIKMTSCDENFDVPIEFDVNYNQISMMA